MTVRSILSSPLSRWLKSIYKSRPTVLLTLCLLLFSSIVSHNVQAEPSLIAQTTPTQDWGDTIDYPPGVYDDPTGEKAEQLIQQLTPKPKPYKKPGFFGRLNPFRPKEAPPPTEEDIINVGPRQYQSKSNPMLALPVTLMNQGKTVPPGFYLIRYQSGQGASYNVTLIKRDTAVMTIPVFPVSARDESTSPVTSLNPDAPPIARLTTELSPDGQSLVLQLSENNTIYKSPALPVVTDTRKQLDNW